MLFTPVPAPIPLGWATKAGAPHYACAGGDLRWTRIPTPPGTAPGPGLEVRWYRGTLFAKVTAQAISPLAGFVPSAPGHGQSWTRRMKAVHNAGYYCEAYPRSDKYSAVVCWKALKWLLEQRNRTALDGTTPFRSPCVPEQQYPREELHRWMQWADQVRLTAAQLPRNRALTRLALTRLAAGAGALRLQCGRAGLPLSRSPP